MKKEITKFNILPDCLNCGKPLSADDHFCSYCGQKNIEKLTFGSFINQLVSGIFSYDSRFWKTFIPLILKPGLLSKHFIEGKRNRYVNPFQLYLNVSIIFFIIIGLNNRIDSENSIQSNETNQFDVDSLLTNNKDKTLQTIEYDSINSKKITTLGNGIKISEKIADSTSHIDTNPLLKLSFSDKLEDFYSFNEKHPKITNSKQALDSLGYAATFWNRFYFERMVKIRKNIEKIQDDKGKGFLKSIVSHFSIGLFIFLPLFTLFLKLIYYNKHMNYMEHLVFVFHTQTVFFLLFIISNILSLVSDLEIAWIFTLSFLIYLYIALKKFYNQGLFKTFLKFTLLNIIYSGLGIVAFLIVSLIAFVFD